jgi:pimeloyl-ACP methyl ester carboxylesterase
MAEVGEPESPLRLSYIDCPPPSGTPSKGVICLIHGFPETSYQFRRVITPLSDAGYRVIAPDYRGAGLSSKPASGYTKSQMATDIRQLLEQLEITEQIWLLGHDIGGMIAYSFALHFPQLLAGVIWGECPIPGTSFYQESCNSLQLWHFVFHNVPDLPEALVSGKERLYLTHFYDKHSYNGSAITKEDVDFYVSQFEKPGAMRCGFELYRAFETDAEENRKHWESHGKCTVPTLALNGEKGFLIKQAGQMCAEAHDELKGNVGVENASHWVAEENPEGFVREVLAFVKQTTT